MNCLDCENQIPPARLEAMPDADYCVNCADKHAAPVVARMIYSHKTAGELCSLLRVRKTSDDSTESTLGHGNIYFKGYSS